MTLGDRERLERIRERIDHVAATARLLSRLGDLPADIADAVMGVGATLDELATRIDEIGQTHTLAGKAG